MAEIQFRGATQMLDCEICGDLLQVGQKDNFVQELSKSELYGSASRGCAGCRMLRQGLEAMSSVMGDFDKVSFLVKRFGSAPALKAVIMEEGIFKGHVEFYTKEGSCQIVSFLLTAPAASAHRLAISQSFMLLAWTSNILRRGGCVVALRGNN